MTLRRLRYQAWGIVLVPLAPLLVPLLGTAAWLDDIGRRQEISRPRYGTWMWRLWWWYGYHGLYQIDWWWKATGPHAVSLRAWLDRPWPCQLKHQPLFFQVEDENGTLSEPWVGCKRCGVILVTAGEVAEIIQT
jgi:hypothetical protein